MMSAPALIAGEDHFARGGEVGVAAGDVGDEGWFVCEGQIGNGEVDFPLIQLQIFPQNPNVFIATAGNIDDHNFRLLHFRSALDDFGDRMRGLKRGNNAFGAS